MKKEQNLNNAETQALNTPVVSKRKYWYRTDVYACVLCGKEKIDRQRVYNKDKAGTHWHDDTCGEHFF